MVSFFLFGLLFIALFVFVLLYGIMLSGCFCLLFVDLLCFVVECGGLVDYVFKGSCFGLFIVVMILFCFAVALRCIC